MKIYIGHSSDIDFQTELYEPIRNAEFYSKHAFIFPHDQGTSIFNPQSFYTSLDLFVAEVSEPSTGLGIELGWCKAAGIKVVCVHKTGTTPSSALTAVSNDIYEYASSKHLLEIIQAAL
jgi:hypothetical protein